MAAPRHPETEDRSSTRETRFTRGDAGDRPSGRPWPADEDVEATGRAGWRGEVASASSLNLLLGLWLVISPSILAYDAGGSAWNAVITGAVISLLALARVFGGYREAWMSWLNAGLGGWLVIAGFWIADGGVAAWNDWIVGSLVVLFGIWSAGATRDTAR